MGILWDLRIAVINSSFGILLSLSCLHGFSRIVGILEFIMDGMVCLDDGGMCLKMSPLFFSYILCMIFSCMRWAGALYVKSLIMLEVMGSEVFSCSVFTISVRCLLSVLNIVVFCVDQLEYMDLIDDGSVMYLS